MKLPNDNREHNTWICAKVIVSRFCEKLIKKEFAWGKNICKQVIQCCVNPQKLKEPIGIIKNTRDRLIWFLIINFLFALPSTLIYVPLNHNYDALKCLIFIICPIIMSCMNCYYFKHKGNKSKFKISVSLCLVYIGSWIAEFFVGITNNSFDANCVAILVAMLTLYFKIFWFTYSDINSNKTTKQMA